MKLSILIPVYNEAATVRMLLERVQAVDLSALGLEKEIVIVNDGSTDDTKKHIEKYQQENNPLCITAIDLPHNVGKGSAIQAALTVATGDFCIIQDADLEYNPQDWPSLLAPLMRGETEVVYGSRQLPFGPDQSRRRLYQIGLIIAQAFLRSLYHQPPTDLATCYKAASTARLRQLNLVCKRFAFDVEVTCKFLNRRMRIVERPISYKPRFKNEGKKIRWRDFFSSMWAMFYFRFFDASK